MAGVSKSAANSKVTDMVDPTTSMIQDEHKRCREALNSAGAGVNTPDQDGQTPLIYAVRPDYSTKVDHTECAVDLIEAGADVNAVDSEDLTALMWAVYGGNSKAVDLLIKAGADVNMKNKDGKTALNYSIVYKSETCGKILIDVGADVNIADNRGNTPLISLVDFNANEKFVAALINAGADVNHSNKEGETALMEAAGYHENTVHVLLAAGADVNIKDQSNNQALQYACFGVPHCNNIEILLQEGADVNNKNADGESPLFCAADSSRDPHFNKEYDQYVEAVNILIKAGADVNAETTDGRTALLLSAAEDGFVKCMKALLEAGADVNRGRNKDGETALICAAHAGHFGCLDSSGAAVDINTPCGHYNGLELLLEAGADVNATDSDGGNALFLRGHHDYNEHYIKCMNRYPKFIKRLLRAGILVNKFKRSQGKNALGILLDYKFKYQNATDDYMTFMGIDTDINYKEPIKLLYAAGETLDGTDVDKIPEVLKFEEEKFQLKHMCRMAIRGHLLSLDSHSNLFGRIPKLGLPAIVTEYLLYSQSLDE